MHFAAVAFVSILRGSQLKLLAPQDEGSTQNGEGCFV